MNEPDDPAPALAADAAEADAAGVDADAVDADIALFDEDVAVEEPAPW